MQTQLAEQQRFEEDLGRDAFQFRVFKNQEYMRLSGFAQPKITIGRSPRADLVLDHRLVEEFHADIAPRGGLFFLTNHYPKNGSRVNGQPAKKILLKDSDVIEIGPFSMVFKPMGPAEPATRREEKVFSPKARKRVVESPVENGGERPGDWFDDTFAVVLDNEYEDTSDQEKVAEKLGALFKKPPDRMLQLLSRPGQVVKKDVSYESAKRLQQLLEMAGAGCELKTMEAMGRRLSDAESATAPAAERNAAPLIWTRMMKAIFQRIST